MKTRVCLNHFWVIVDDNFQIGQFIIEGFDVPYRVDRNANGGGIMLFVRENIPSKLLSVENSPTEAFFVEINLKKKKMVTQLLLQSK